MIQQSGVHNHKLMSTTQAVRNRVEALMKERRLRVADMCEATGLSNSTYYSMWHSESVTLERLAAMAKVLGVSVSNLLGEVQDVGAPAAEPAKRPPYLEERIERLETELRKLKIQIQNR